MNMKICVRKIILPVLPGSPLNPAGPRLPVSPGSPFGPSWILVGPIWPLGPGGPIGPGGPAGPINSPFLCAEITKFSRLVWRRSTDSTSCVKLIDIFEFKDSKASSTMWITADSSIESLFTDSMSSVIRRTLSMISNFKTLSRIK